ncbi:sigma-70 family RNA polymerase sigma factor [Leucobacter viscericola]|uniref:Sigma-70 family RNA polymerase sigma factor n=2 Tax=Leucobacter viscericola TaxID=2714935 RepID=A0A6G7XEH6_9MICO|nr:sigma-70 family RNA polymerase sigma factor [Leucobacter viscericola]
MGNMKNSEDSCCDAEIVARSRDRPGEFGKLYDRHARAVFRYIASRLGAEQADDLTGETFLVAFERRERYDATFHSALPWLLGIATRLIRRRRRDEVALWRLTAASQGLGGEGTVHAIHDPFLDTEDRIDAGLAVSSIAGVIAKLPKRDRDVLTLAAWSELDSAGIAEALKIPVGTVRSRLHRARKIIRTHLDVDHTPSVEGCANETEKHYATA